MIQCKLFTSSWPELEINRFLEENPGYRYVHHSASAIPSKRSNEGDAMLHVILFYETNPHSFVRSVLPAAAAIPIVPPASLGEQPQWEYISYLFVTEWRDLHVRLQEWGEQGWEAYQHNSIRSGGVYVFFKRKKLPNGEANQTG